MNCQFVKISAEAVAGDLEAIRKASPLVHNITNYVVMNITANALLAIGASPIMADARKEVEEITSHSDALVLNIGTLSTRWSQSMLLSLASAARGGIPTVLDPVGAGISTYRMNIIGQLLKEHTPSVIKGNPSEIQAVSNLFGITSVRKTKSKGVDTTLSGEDILECAVELSEKIRSTVVITGPTDYITDGTRIARIRNGSALMAATTGMGCTASAITGAFLAVSNEPFRSAVSALAVMGIAGEVAAQRSLGNGSFPVNFLDELYLMDRNRINQYLICEE